jgi:transposase-like protein
MPRHELPPERKAALVAELLIYKAALRRAEEDLKIHVSRAYDAGMNLRDIAKVLDMKSSNTAMRWRDEGGQARNRRRSEDPLRPGEPDPVS